MELVKAKLKITTLEGTPEVDVMFNPGEYTIARNMTYAEIAVPGLSMPLLQFVRGEAQTLQLELFVDSSDRKAQDLRLAPPGASAAPDPQPAFSLASNTGVSVERVPTDRWANLGKSNFAENRLACLRLLGQIDSHLHAPHVVEFTWGGQIRFRGVVASFSEKFTMFDEAGHIQRARVSLQLKSFASADDQYRAINPQSPDRTKTHVVREGDRLDLLADRYYGDPGHWLVIARANGLSRPRLLEPGLLLTLPPLD